MIISGFALLMGLLGSTAYDSLRDELFTVIPLFVLMGDLIQDSLTSMGLGTTGIYLLMIVIWLVLGTLLDSASIILLTVPIFAPVAMALGFDPIAFAIFGILAIEAGLLTPPVGLLVYTVKGAVTDPDVTLGEIFKGSIPYWLLMLLVMVMVMVWMLPGLATWLPEAVL